MLTLGFESLSAANVRKLFAERLVSLHIELETQLGTELSTYDFSPRLKERIEACNYSACVFGSFLVPSLCGGSAARASSLQLRNWLFYSALGKREGASGRKFLHAAAREICQIAALVRSNVEACFSRVEEFCTQQQLAATQPEPELSAEAPLQEYVYGKQGLDAKQVTHLPFDYISEKLHELMLGVKNNEKNLLDFANTLQVMVHEQRCHSLQAASVLELSQRLGQFERVVMHLVEDAKLKETAFREAAQLSAL